MRSRACATLILASSNGKSFRACSTIDEAKSGILTASLTAYLYPMNDAFAAQNVGGFAKIVADVRLLANPIEITPDPGGKINLRRVTRRANPLGAAREVAHFAGPEFAVYFRRDLNV